jgi:hypothetical protein
VLTTLPTHRSVPPQLTAANKDYALNKIGHVLSQIDVGTKEARAAQACARAETSS